MIYNIANSKQVDIQAGDWVDVNPGMWGEADPVWGFSVQVYDVDGTYVWCYVWNGTDYDQSAVDASIIVDNYRKIPFES